jgi:hypothetical protein
MGWENLGIALITGASAGIGEDFANQLAAQGFNLALVARRKEKLEELATQLQQKYAIQCDIIAADLAIEEGVAQVVEYIKNSTALDLVINNAGFGTLGVFADVPLEKSLEMLQVHVVATMKICHTAIPKMIEHGRGGIINVASMNAFLYFPGNTMYQATKSFLNAFSRGLALDYGNKNLRIQVLCPGFTHTEFHSVRDFSNFNKGTIPKFMWMKSEEVVRISLNSLSKNQIVVIPGTKNKIFKWLFLHTPVGTGFQKSFLKRRGLKK